MLLIKGNVEGMDLDTGRNVKFAKQFGLVHDPTGKVLNRCVLYVCRYRVVTKHAPAIPKRLISEVESYYGDGARLARATVEIPKGPWQRLGVVKTIHYVRINLEDSRRDGLFYHHFDGSEGPWHYTFKDSDPIAILHESVCSKAYNLELPDGCIVNDRGFVWP